jgi:NAD(P)-dependent dehydrogenase (short-subunit alcohol dehydrogenase family)
MHPRDVTGMRIGRDTRAVITGAGSGLGRALAAALAARGATVVASDVRAAAAEDTAEAIRVAGGQAFAVGCDVTRVDDVARLAAEASRLAGDVDLLVNNAGIGAAGRIGDGGLDTWHRTVEVNLWGVVYGCHYFVPRMRARGRGHVLNVASAAAFGSAPSMGAYNVTKSAVVALSETLAAEASSYGVGVTVLCPGFFRTNILADSVGVLTDEQRRYIESEMSRSRHDADDVARIALDAVEAGKLYAVPHAEIRWLWRAKRLAPGLFTRLVGTLDRRGYFRRM